MTSETPLSSFTTRRRIEFADTDMGGIVHFARFFVFLETAEHEFLEAVGTTVHHERDGHRIGWPRVSASLEYQSPARLGDELTIELRVARKGASSMTYDFAVRAGHRPVAKGRMSSACCVLSDPAGIRAIPIPPDISDRIAEDE
ncbi:MAG: acyl-CoA thioesterase [Thermoanaerobaculia bacterium]